MPREIFIGDPDLVDDLRSVMLLTADEEWSGSGTKTPSPDSTPLEQPEPVETAQPQA